MANKPTILVADKLPSKCFEVMRAGGLKPIEAIGLEKKEVVRYLERVDGVVVRSATKIGADVISSKSRIKVIGRAGIGIDNIDVTAASMQGIAVFNTPNANANSAAEHTLALMFSISRKVVAADASVRSGKWERSKFVGSEVFGKIIGIIGFGTIGKIVATRCLSLGMRVIVFDPFVPDDLIKSAGFDNLGLDAMLAECDYLTVHTPLNKDTENLIVSSKLALMKPTAYVIQCARGGIINEKELAKALNQDKLAGAAVDVYTTEPPKDNPLLKAKNTILTPHLGASTKEAQIATGLEISRLFVEYFAHGDASAAINLPKSSPANPLNQAQIGLARSLGKLLAATRSAKCQMLTISLCGEMAQLTEQPLVGELLIGFLAESCSYPVSLFNANLIATNRGLKVSIIKKEDAEGFASLLQVKAKFTDGEISLAGTLLGGTSPRLVSYLDMELEAPLTGNILITRHLDEPGVVAKISKLVASEKINIVNMHVNSATKKGYASLFAKVNKPLPSSTVLKINKLAEVTEAITLRF